MDSLNNYGSSDEEGPSPAPTSKGTSSSIKINSAPDVGGEVSTDPVDAEPDCDPDLTVLVLTSLRAQTLCDCIQHPPPQKCLLTFLTVT